ncbi:MAG: hypothetical protein M1840_007721 [Geoglossum simile]|nr:MAG: hypothetical protein M1840_007721 [Geoglossum simile]
MSSYSEINLDETPIILLRCGHFFTAETLDSLLNIGSVYETDMGGDFIGLKDFSGELAEQLPTCPNCRQPLQQYSTQRYNRIINRAIIDEMTKRFTISTESERQRLQDDVEALARDLAASRETLLSETTSISASGAHPESIINMLLRREYKALGLNAKINSFLTKFAEEQQPARKLYDATRKAAEVAPDNLQELSTSYHVIGALPADSLASTHGKFLQLRFQFVRLTDQLLCVQKIHKAFNSTPTRVPNPIPTRISSFFEDFQSLIHACQEKCLFRLEAEARLCFAELVALSRVSGVFDNPSFQRWVDRAKDAVGEAMTLCDKGFEGAEGLKKALEEAGEKLGKEFYETVTGEEYAIITMALREDLRGTTGHWYNCQNGHPVSSTLLFQHMTTIYIN